MLYRLEGKNQTVHPVSLSCEIHPCPRYPCRAYVYLPVNGKYCTSNVRKLSQRQRIWTKSRPCLHRLNQVYKQWEETLHHMILVSMPATCWPNVKIICPMDSRRRVNVSIEAAGQSHQDLVDRCPRRKRRLWVTGLFGSVVRGGCRGPSVSISCQRGTPENIWRLLNVGTMLGQLRRRWANIVPTLGGLSLDHLQRETYPGNNNRMDFFFAHLSTV